MTTDTARENSGAIANNFDKDREMKLAIPYETNKVQLEAIQKSVDYAKSKGIVISITKVK